MAHLIAPITVEGIEMCCDPITRRTTEILIEAANAIGPNEWEIYRAAAYWDSESNPSAESEEPVSGTVVFGVCCGTQVVLEVWGEIEILNTGYDWLEVRLNGAREFYHESTEVTDADPWGKVAVGPFNVTINLPERPCGNIIEIDGSTDDAIANNDVWWKAKILSIQ
jgi:hypothetical protein